MIYVIGIGPGCRDLMTQEAISAMEDAEVIVGYKTYIKLVEDFVKDKEVVQNGMRKEVDRCQDAIDIAKTGKKVAVISSGDAGIYGMAGLILELITKQELDIPVKVVPGVTASIGAAAVLGAPIIPIGIHGLTFAIAISIHSFVTLTSLSASSLTSPILNILDASE